MGREFTVKIRARPRLEEFVFCSRRGTVYFDRVRIPHLAELLRKRHFFFPLSFANRVPIVIPFDFIVCHPANSVWVIIKISIAIPL